MGDRISFQHQTPTHGEQLELVEHPRLPQPRLAHHADDLAMAGFGMLQRSLELFYLPMASNEAGESSPRRHLEPRTQQTDAEHFIDVEQLFPSFDLRLTEILELKIAI